MRAASHPRNLVSVLGGVLLLLVLGFAGCSRAPDPWREAKAGQQRILATFPPLYCLTQAIAGDDAYVLCFLSTQGPHEFHFSPPDAVKAKGASLLVSNGLGLDDEFVRRIANFHAVPQLVVGAELPKEMLLDLDDDDDEPEPPGKHEAHHHHDKTDPHIWLGPPQALLIADSIGKKLAEIDSAHADGYTKRTAQLKDQLKKLHEDGKERFKDKKSRKVLTMHDSFGYFAKAFGLEVAGSIRAQPDEPPPPARLAKLAALKQVTVITFEPQYSDATAKVLQEELQKKHAVQLVEFDPLETAPVPEGSANPSPDYYLEKMRANIDNLAKALP